MENILEHGWRILGNHGWRRCGENDGERLSTWRENISNHAWSTSWNMGGDIDGEHPRPWKRMPGNIGGEHPGIWMKTVWSNTWDIELEPLPSTT